MASVNAGSFSALAWHTTRVLLGSEAALDVASAQHVGPAASAGFVHMVVRVAGVLFVLHHLLQVAGLYAAQRCCERKRHEPKLAAAFAQCVYYSYTSTCALCVCWHADWFWPRGWASIMADGRVQQVPGAAPYTAPAELVFLYALQSAYYVTQLGVLAVAARKKDHWQMLLHHVVTLLLMLLSFHAGYLRVGTVVMWLHDVFDPFMLLAKCAHYSGATAAANALFACCLAAFAVPRLCLFPALIVHAWLSVCPGSASCPGGVWDKTGVELVLLALLCVLVPIHVFWMRMLGVVLVRALQTAAVSGDVRSDSDDDNTAPPPRSRPGRARERRLGH